MLKEIFRSIFSRPLFQPFFEFCVFCSLKAINIGDGHNVHASGESNTVDILKKVTDIHKAVVFDVGAHTGEWLEMFRGFSDKATPMTFCTSFCIFFIDVSRY